VFEHGKHFQHSPIFVCKAGTYPIKDLSGAPLQGSLLGLPTNKRLGWKGLPWTNTLAFSKIRKLLIKKLYNIGPSRATLSITTLRITAISIMILRIMTSSITTFSITVKSAENVI
jgi:hypothetical protein